MLRSSSSKFLLLILCIVCALPALADNVTISGTVTFDALDGSSLDHDGTANGIFTVNDGSLTILGTINCNDVDKGTSACPMQFVVSGNVTLGPSAAVYAENRVKDGNGGDITFLAGGNVLLQSGALISSSKTNGGSAFHAGAVTINSGGTFTSQSGSTISAASNDGQAGTITVTSSGLATVGGNVLAGPTRTLSTATLYTGIIMSGGGANVGGNITIDAQSHNEPGLIVANTAIIATQTGDVAGTSTITLKGCDVRIDGLVAALGKKIAGPRISIRSGTNLTIDGSSLPGPGAHLGRVRADSTAEDASTNRIDLFAKNAISITGPSSGMFAVTANAGDKGDCGTINVLSTGGTVTASGNALAATASQKDEGGGNINVSAKGNVTLNGASVNASGGTSGSNRSGGDIAVRSYSGAIAWQSGVGDVRPVGSSAGVPAAQQGTISLTYCTSISTSGTSFPTNGSPVGVFPTTAQTCSPAAPSLPAGVTLPDCNTPPVAVNDAYSVAEGGTLTVAAPGVLGNDSDPEGQPITATLVSGPAHASSFTFNADGSFSYTHDGSETLSDSFTYKANDGTLDSNVATVNITITPVNDVPVANNDSATVAEGGTINFAAPGVLANDTDPDSSLTAVLVSGPAHAASFALNADGSYTYVHDGSETTSDSFTYKAYDGVAYSNVATVSITITAVNDVPVANNDSATVAEGGTINAAAPGVLGNDTDPDSSLTAVLVSGPAHASSFTLNADGSYTYVHDGSETTSDSFTYKASDGSAFSNVATVSITITPVNDPPVANDDAATVAEGGTLNVAAPGVLGNDSDPDSSITAVLVSGPAHASSFALNADGSYTYVHDGSETTSDSFTYKASDGASFSNVATVTITITAVNDAPTAVADAYSVNEGGTLNVAAPGVLTNDSDPDSSITAVLVSGPAHATSFTLNADGSFSYTHDGSETTSDSFTYKATDGSLDSSVVTVTLTINAVDDAPVAADDTFTVAEGGTLTIAAPGVLVNDTDADNPTLTAVLVSGPAHAASFSLNADGSFTYVHDGSETLSDSFTYKASDGTLQSNTATVNITITPVNDAPVAVNDTYSVDEGGSLTIAAPGVLTNDSDAENDSMTVTLVSGPAHAASFALNADGSFSYVHDGGETTSDSFTYKVSDGSSFSNVATVTITVNPINDAPVLTGGTSLSYTENQGTVIIDGSITITDPDSPTMAGATVQITSGYANGQDVLVYTPVAGISGSFNAATGTLTLSGTASLANYQTALRNVKYLNSSDDPSTAARTITFQVNDGGSLNNLSNTVSSTVTVIAVNDAPTAFAYAGLPAQAGIPITYPAGKLGGSDVEAGTTITIDTTPVNLVNIASLVINADGSFTMTPTPGSAGGSASFQYRVSDDGNPAPGLNSAYVTVSFAVSGPAIYFVKNPAAGTGNCTLGNECLVATAVAMIGSSPNALIFLGDANTHVLAGSVTLNSGGSIIGQGLTGFASFDAFFGIAPPSQGVLAARPAIGQPRPTLTGGTVVMNNNSQLRGYNASVSGALSAITAASRTGLAIDLGTVSTSNNTASTTYAVDLTGPSSGTKFNFGAITGGGTGVSSHGVRFNATSTTTVTFSTISTSAGDAFSSSSTGATNFSFGNITSGAGDAVNVATSSGNFTFVNVTSATGAAVTTSSTGGGAFQFNDVTSTTGRAVDVNTGTGAFTFHAISANGSATGVLVQNLTGGASFTVNGTGTTAGSGGTLQNCTAKGGDFRNVANLTLKNMNFTNNATANLAAATTCGDVVSGGNNGPATCNANLSLSGGSSNILLQNVTATASNQIGIDVNTASNLTLNNVTVTGNGDEVGEDGVQLYNVTGTLSVIGGTFRDNAANQFEAGMSGGTLNATVTGATIGNTNFPSTSAGVAPSPGNSTANSGLLFHANSGSNATMNATVTSSTFSGNYSYALRWDAANGTSSGTVNFGQVSNGNTFTNNGLGIGISSTSNGTVTYSVRDNVLTNNTAVTSTFSTSPVSMSFTGNAARTGTIDGNSIGVNGGATASGCFVGGCAGIEVTDSAAQGTHNVSVTNNQIFHVNGSGILLTSSGASTETLRAKIQNNSVAQPDGTSANAGILVQDGNSTPNGVSITCLDVSANAVSGLWAPATTHKSAIRILSTHALLWQLTNFNPATEYAPGVAASTCTTQCTGLVGTDGNAADFLSQQNPATVTAQSTTGGSSASQIRQATAAAWTGTTGTCP